MRINSLVFPLCACLALMGCTRATYLKKADEETYAILGEQSGERLPWSVPKAFTIEPDPASRLHDASSRHDPLLPVAGPHLYSYPLPPSVGLSAERALDSWRSQALSRARQTQPADIGALTVQPIPKNYWDAVPAQYLSRMLEFESVRKEWFDQYAASPPETLHDKARRLDLRSILKLAQLNSREYQAQKESLYQAALAVTSARFDYTPKFTQSGNGADGDATHNRTDGETINSAGVGSSLQAEKMLSTGGTVLGRIANDLVVTFDGPEGFATDVSSSLFLEINQTVFQRDIQLNPLVQAERNLVYAARDYARFRRQFFTDIAARYYGLLRTYRSIEIESQNYFSLIRTFEQAKAEVRAGVKNAPNPVTVDQYEQGMLSGRSSLISTCNGLEDGLDQLKLQVGLPTETAVNINLSELRELTLMDQIEVAAERVRRWQRRVNDVMDRTIPNRDAMLNADIFLMERLIQWLRLREKVEPLPGDFRQLEIMLAQFRVDQARIPVGRTSADLEYAKSETALSPVIVVYQRTSDLLEAQLDLARVQIALLRQQSGKDAGTEEAAEWNDVKEALARSLEGLADVLQDAEQVKLRELLTQAEALVTRTGALVANLDARLQSQLETDPDALLADTKKRTQLLMARTQSLLSSSQTGLPTYEIEMDEAMATALVQRLDLMNERGRLADDWRNIKISADDLKSILNFNLSQAIGTHDNRAVDFTMDNSQTRLGLNFDLPLNRLNQRNDFRRALINYQAGRRSLMSLEDNIKLNVRSGLRSLAETQLQYPISVTRAALAAEQETSIRLQLALGIPGVRGTDLLDALQSSREALIGVANSRIGYIVDNADFVLQLELMRLDASGYWAGLNNREFQPVPDLNYPEFAGPTYGEIPSFLKVSKKIKRMLTSPLPGASLVDADPSSTTTTKAWVIEASSVVPLESESEIPSPQRTRQTETGR